MVSTIENAFIKLSVKSSGAEMLSLKGKKSSIEYLWQGDPDVWPRKAPVLFPIVGKLNENKYHLGSEVFTLPQHGFARNLIFDLVEEKANALTYLLKANQETFDKYPFDFALAISYTLQGKTVSVTYRVENTGSKTLFFTIGGHPGFNIVVSPGEAFEDYYLEFEKEEQADRYLLEEGLFTGATESILKHSKKLPLNRAIFKSDAIVLKNLASDFVRLKSTRSNFELRFDFQGFPYLGIWTPAKEAPFVCIEPWMGLADKKGFTGNFSEKEGILSLEAGKTFTCTYAMELTNE